MGTSNKNVLQDSSEDIKNIILQRGKMKFSWSINVNSKQDIKDSIEVMTHALGSLNNLLEKLNRAKHQKNG